MSFCVKEAHNLAIFYLIIIFYYRVMQPEREVPVRMSAVRCMLRVEVRVNECTVVKVTPMGTFTDKLLLGLSFWRQLLPAQCGRWP
jgi:hypothetical protein